MDAEDFKTMLLSQEVLESRNLLAQMRASDFSSLKDEERQRVHKELHKKAFPNIKPKVMTSKELERFLNG